MNPTLGDDHADRQDDHDERRDDQHDRRLLAGLRGADPAAGLSPLSADTVGDLLGSITRIPRMSRGEAGEGAAGGDDVVDEAPAATTAAVTAAVTATATAAAGAPSAQVDDLAGARRRRQRRRWGGVAGLGLAAAAAGVIALTTGLPGITGTTGTTTPTVTTLQAAGPVAGGPATSCTVLEPAWLLSFDTAFEGRVLEVRQVEGGEVVVMEVERVYRGDLTQRVEVSTPGAGSLLDGTVSLVQGGDYLVAASEGQVAGCGATGETSPELGALYEQAFGAGR